MKKLICLILVIFMILVPVSCGKDVSSQSQSSASSIHDKAKMDNLVQCWQDALYAFDDMTARLKDSGLLDDVSMKKIYDELSNNVETLRIMIDDKIDDMSEGEIDEMTSKVNEMGDAINSVIALIKDFVSSQQSGD